MMLKLNSQSLYYRLEAVGKFPTNEEANQYKINLETPVWLPVKSDMQEIFNDTVSQKLAATSIWMGRGYAL